MAASGATAAAAPATSSMTPKAFKCNFCTLAGSSTPDAEPGDGATSSVDIEYLQIKKEVRLIKREYCKYAKR
jgi:hypothetical protein